MDIRILDIIEETTVDGPGFRTSIYCAGCHHHCAGCHNPQSWDVTAGTSVNVESLLNTILSNPFTNVTYSGGDPMFQALGFAQLSQLIKEHSSKTIWCYTGFTFEQLFQKKEQEGISELLHHIDVLVDGPFILSLRDESLRFRGSSNQRIIDVPRSLEQGTVVLWDDEESF